MADVRTCVVYDVPFGEERGLEAALLANEDAAQETRGMLLEEGFQASVHCGPESPWRFWYLKTNAPFDILWSILGCFFDAYLHLEHQPGECVRVTESCPCAFCREPDSDEGTPGEVLNGRPEVPCYWLRPDHGKDGALRS